MKILEKFTTLACHELDHHQDATMLIKNQNKVPYYNEEKATEVSTIAANLAKSLSPHGDPCGDADLSFILQCIIYSGHILGP